MTEFVLLLRMDLPAKQCEEVAEVADPQNRPLQRNPPSVAEVAEEVNPDWNSARFVVEATRDWSMSERLGPV